MLSRLELSSRFPIFAKFVSSSLPLHGSHRGGRHWGRENTLETYRRAVHEARTDMLEIDIRKTIDEHLVLNHDDSINGQRVNQTTFQTLQQLNPELITLDQLLKEFLPVSSLIFFFDMKDIHAIPLTLEMIKQYHLEDRVILGANDRSINKELQKLKPASVPICADVEGMLKIGDAYKRGQLNNSYPYEHDIVGLFLEPHTRALLSEDLIQTLHKAGKPLILVGSLLDDPRVQREMIELGIDILLTDRPDILRQTLDSYSR